MRILTGMPTKNYPMDSFATVDALWDKMVFLTGRDYPQTAGTRTNEGGIVKGHAYTILKTAALKDASGKVVHRLVQVRNPWSSEMYTGDFSDKSDKWTEDFKKQVGGLE